MMSEFGKIIEHWRVIAEQVSWYDRSYLNWFWLLPVFITVYSFGIRRLRRRLDLIQRIVPYEKQYQVLRGIAAWKGVFLTVAFCATICAMAGPRIGWRWIDAQQSGIDMVVAVDVSKSMLATDLNPSRLERARRMIMDLLEVASGDRIGLVLFAGAAFVQCPLTVDHNAVYSFLDDLNTDAIPVGGTNLAGALRESLRALGAGGENTAQGQGKLVILLSDGEDHEGAVDEAIQAVIRTKAKVIAIGLGSERGGPIPDKQGGFQKDQHGNVIVSKLDDRMLKKIAEETGGQYVRAEVAGASVADIYKDIVRKSGSLRETVNRKERVWFERFQWPAAVALGLLLIDIFVKETGVVAGLWLLSFGVGLLGVPTASAAADRTRYNEAVSAIQNNETEKAEEAFVQLLDSSDPEVRKRAHYNLGNIMAAKGRYQEAVQQYEAALSVDSQDQQARDNLKWARNKAQEQKQDQQKQDQQKQDQQKQDQQKQDQQKQDQQKQDQQKQDQQKQDQQKQDQRKGDMSEEDAEKLLRSAPDERRSLKPLFRSQQSQPKSVDRDW